MQEHVFRPTVKYAAIGLVLSVLVFGFAAVFLHYRLAEPDLRLLIIPGLLFLWPVKSYAATMLICLRLRGGRIELAQGLLARSSRMMDLGKIRDVQLEQGLFDRLLNVGKIAVFPLGEGGPMELGAVDDPKRVRDLIMGQPQ